MKRKDTSPEVKMNGKILQALKQTKLLRIILDSKLTMKPKLESMKKIVIIEYYNYKMQQIAAFVHHNYPCEICT